ncbi:hypothetical protein B296_00019839, partial [Ensete ventricosum]
MKLNRVESFYAFLLCFRSEGSPCKGQPGMATVSPLAGAVDHLQGGGRLQPRPPCKGSADCGHAPARGDRLQPRPPCKGVAGCGKAPVKGRSAAARSPAKGRL